MKGKVEYKFIAKMWKHSASGGWHFVTVPESISKEIRENFGWQEEGWGRMKTRAKNGDHSWETAIWFDTKMNTYILPIKAEIRKKSNLELNTDLELSIWL